MGEHNRQTLEHQSRTGIRGNAEAEERRENHKARQYGDDGIGNCRDNCGLNQIFVFIQIAGQGNHHAETQAQGEKYLPQNEDEQFGGNLAEVRLQIESNPFHRARQGNVAYDHGNQE